VALEPMQELVMHLEDSSQVFVSWLSAPTAPEPDQEFLVLHHHRVP
jgi:hypothetical protein